MKLLQLIFAEIAFRKISFILGCLSLAIALAVVSGSKAMIRLHDLRTEKIVEQKEAETREAMARMENDYRIIMKRMGYNVIILSDKEDISQMQLRGYPEETIPFANAEKLAASEIMSLNHQLPVLQRQITWPEKGETILLCGVRGQMPLASRPKGQSPIQAPIPAGRVALGNTLAKRINVAAGETIVLMGETFTVERVDPLRGNGDDMAIWVALEKVQQWLDLPGRISGILALECVCHADALGMIVEEVTDLLPDVQVFEFTSKVQGRAEARKRAAETSRQAIIAEKEQRDRLRAERVRLAGTMGSVAVTGAALWVLALMYGNTRERQSEIGILRAVGLRRSQIIWLLLGKALLIGAIGGAIGVGAVWFYEIKLSGHTDGSLNIWRSADLGVMALLWLGGVVVAGVAALLPVLQAARRDPAEILSKE